MKPPKNFYSNLDRRKQGLPEVPEASASDAGKIIKVGEDGAYELGSDEGLPAVIPADTKKLLQVISGVYSLSAEMSTGAFLQFTTTGLSSTYTTCIKIRRRSTTLSWTLLGISYTFANIINRLTSNAYMLYIDDDSGAYQGFIYTNTSSTISAFVIDTSGKLFRAYIDNTSITFTPIQVGTKYYEITASGSSVSLPSGVTFADVYAELMAGVDVKFTSGARVYTVTSFESTNIRAHWFTDLDLTSMEVYVINLASDGTGTVASATFSGS